MKTLTIPGLVLYALLAAPLYAEGPAVGDSTASGASEVDAHTQKVLQQLRELSEKARTGTPQFSLVGKVERAKNGNLLVNGEEYRLASDVIITGDFAFGKIVEMRGDLHSGTPRVVSRMTVFETAPAAAHARGGPINQEGQE